MRTTVVFCRRGDSVLLAKQKPVSYKTIREGIGKWNGYGGRVEEGESIVDAAVREVREEARVNVRPEALILVAIAKISLGGVFRCEMHAFVADEWEGEACETEEMGPPTSFLISDLPLEEMWVSDRRWIQRVLLGEALEVEVNLTADGSAIQTCECRPATFSS